MRPNLAFASGRQRGAASLIVVLSLLVGALLLMLGGHRQALLDLRMAANQSRGAIAFEAAEAGLTWALAQAQSAVPLGADCLADAAASGDFRERIFGTGARPVCRLDGLRWQCACPTTGRGDVDAVHGVGRGAAVVVSVQDGPRPGTWRIAATGCHALDGACDDAGGDVGMARAETLVALLPALRTLPPAAITQPGSTAAEAFFITHFGLARPAWAAQPAVTPTVCETPCNAALARSLADAGVRPVLHVAGPMTLNGPLVVGAPGQPVLIVADGPLLLGAGVTVHGLVAAAGVTLASGATVRGGVLSDGPFTGDAAQVTFDAAVLAPLATRYGSVVRLPGSWRDF